MTAIIPADMRQELTKRFGSRVKFDEPMAGHTTFRVGGPADLFVMPENEDEISFLLHMAKDRGLPHVVMGGGANILVRDRGIRGMVISLAGRFTGILRDDDENAARLTVLAGTRLSACCRYALENGLAGLNFAIGIPGSVGGAILMNAGASGGSMENAVCGVRVMDMDTGVADLGPDDLNWSYRELSFRRSTETPEPEDVLILSCVFGLTPGDPKFLKTEADAIMRHRRSVQPWDQSSAGCFFKNPPEGEPAGKLIEQAGLKGVVLGGAAVSEKHANFIVNREKASAEDIIRLSERIQETVYRRFGVALAPEVRIMGE
jgi:UDP-N-acetylmuramate dehydrogenase